MCSQIDNLQNALHDLQIAQIVKTRGTYICAFLCGYVMHVCVEYTDRQCPHFWIFCFLIAYNAHIHVCIYRWLAAYSAAASFRYSHYFVSFLSQFGTLATGIGYVTHPHKDGGRYSW